MELKLFYLLLGCTPIGRHTEQHDVFFCIGRSLKDILPEIHQFWPDAGTIHIDCWREVSVVDGNRISIIEKRNADNKTENLFFINLGGYLPQSFEEHHHKLLTVAKDMANAIGNAKQTDFYKNYNSGDQEGNSHVDNKYGVDVDEIFNVQDILPVHQKLQYAISITKEENPPADKLHIGYLKLSSL